MADSNGVATGPHTPGTPPSNGASSERVLTPAGYAVVGGVGYGAGYLAYKLSSSPLIGVGAGLIAALLIEGPIKNFSIK